MTRTLVIDQANVDGTTGLHVVQVKVKETNPDTGEITFGIMEVYAISGEELEKVFKGDVEHWLKTRVAAEMLEKHKRRANIHTKLMSMQGAEIPLDTP